MRILQENVTSEQAYAALAKIIHVVQRYNYEGENSLRWNMDVHNFGSFVLSNLRAYESPLEGLEQTLDLIISLKKDYADERFIAHLILPVIVDLLSDETVAELKSMSDETPQF